MAEFLFELSVNGTGLSFKGNSLIGESDLIFNIPIAFYLADFFSSSESIF